MAKLTITIEIFALHIRDAQRLCNQILETATEIHNDQIISLPLGQVGVAMLTEFKIHEPTRLSKVTRRIRRLFA